ncbi:MAG: Cro/Cl family transcriptional regulator [bacterium]
MIKPVFKVEYENKDITAHISPNVLSVSYTDFEHGQSDEAEILIEDKDHLWKSGWYPSKGDTISLNLGYAGEKLLNCGSFEIDELEFSSPPDTITVKALAANIKKALRQANSVAYENKTLFQIAQEIALKHNLKLVGSIKDIKIKRITQNKKRDLEFLKNLAEEYGYIFKVSDNKLTFFETAKLKASNPALIINRKDLISFSLRDKTHDQYKSYEVSYHDPKSKKLITSSIKGSSAKADALKIHKRCENKEQAILKATAAMNKNSSLEGNITLMGNPNLVAGLNIELKGLYNLSGKYHIQSAKHTIDRSTGYKTELDIEKC